MAGRKIENASVGASDWTSEIESKNIQKKGWYNLTFTNMDNTSIPAIAAGSNIDINGVLYIFDSEEAITDPGVSDGIVYVTIAGSATATASFTNTALPDYDYDKKGYYGVSGERYVAEYSLSNSTWNFLYKTDDSYESNKSLIENQDNNSNFLFNLSEKNFVRKTDPAADIGFGRTADISGDYAVIASSQDGGIVNYYGAAYIYYNTVDGDWSSRTKIVKSSRGNQDYFGQYVAIDGDYVVLSDHLDASNTGAVWVHHRTGTNTWDAGVKVVPPGAVGQAKRFGKYPDIDGDYFVGNYQSGGPCTVFYRTGTNTWDSGYELTGGDGRISGDYIITPGSNKATITRRTGTNTWDDEYDITLSAYPHKVDISGDYAIVSSSSGYSSEIHVIHRTDTNVWDGEFVIDVGVVLNKIRIDGDIILGSGVDKTMYFYKRFGINYWKYIGKISAQEDISSGNFDEPEIDSSRVIAPRGFASLSNANEPAYFYEIPYNN
jgi:hypothetical protein